MLPDSDADEVAIDEIESGLPAPSDESLPNVAEALIFVSEDPVPPALLARTLSVSRQMIDIALDAIAESLSERGLRLQIGPDGAQIITAPEASRYVEYFLGLEARRRLSNAALETLAIVAYQQPVTRATVDTIRGVSSDGSIATLRARGLIEDAGRADGPGRARLFVTTQRFLEHFGLERPQDLPPLDVLAPLPPPDVPEALEGMDATASEESPGEAESVVFTEPDRSEVADETATGAVTDEAAAEPSTQSESDAAPASF
jgi:segregation and condensation protein B